VAAVVAAAWALRAAAMAAGARMGPVAGAVTAAAALGALALALAAYADESGNSKDRTAQLTAEISRVRQASDGWHSGLALNVVTLNSLRDTAEGTNAQLAELQGRQRAGEKLDQEVAKAQQVANEAQDRYNQALDENVKQQDRVVAATQRRNALSQQSADLAIRMAQSELALAEVKGDCVAIGRAENEVMDAQVAALQQAAAGKQDEIVAYDGLIAATQRKLAADGVLDESDKAQLAMMADTRKGMVQEQEALGHSADSTRDLSDAKKKQKKASEEAAAAAKKAAEAEKEHAEQTAAAGSLIGGILSGWQRRLGGLSDATREAFNSMMHLGDSGIFAAKNLTNFEDRLKNIEELERIAFKGRDFGFVKWLNETAIKALELEKAFIGQAQAADQVLAAFKGIGEGGAYAANGMETLILNAETAKRSLNLLDAARLEKLQAEIDKANEKLKQMQEEAQSAQDRIQELNSEIAAERGDSATADRLKLQLEQEKAIREVEAEIAKARADNNRDLISLYEEQKRKLEELYAIKDKNLQADIQSRAQQQQQQQQQGSPASTSASTVTSAAPPVKTYTLNLNAKGQSLEATTTTDPMAFLTALETAQRSAI
jgi:hypothetical protein